MDYLLDTCTVSDFIKGDIITIGHLKSKLPLQIKISTITAYELQYGLLKNPQIKKETRTAILGFLNDIEIIPFGEDEVSHAAIVRSNLEKEGEPVGAYDVLIAATALSHEFILVTANEKEFVRIPGLRIENWRLKER